MRVRGQGLRPYVRLDVRVSKVRWDPDAVIRAVDRRAREDENRGRRCRVVVICRVVVLALT